MRLSSVDMLIYRFHEISYHYVTRYLHNINCRQALSMHPASYRRAAIVKELLAAIVDHSLLKGKLN